MSGCWGWIKPHHAVRASFHLSCWSAESNLPARYSALWPACWTGVTDKSRNSGSAEVRRIWEVYDEQLQRVSRVCRDHTATVPGAGVVSEAWRIWSLSAEVSLVRTCLLTGGPASACGLKVGRGAAVFREVVTDRPLGSVGQHTARMTGDVSRI